MRAFVFLTAVLAASALQLRAQAPAAPDDAVRTAAARQIASQYGLKGHAFAVRVDQVRADLTPRDSIRVTLSGGWETPRGRVRADLQKHMPGGGWTESGWAMLYVSHYDSVMVSRETLRPDDRLSAEGLKPVSIDVTRFRDEPLTAGRFREKCRREACFVRQYVREGDVIRRDAVRHRYAARAGEMVQVIYDRHGISARLRCKARQSGFAGDLVRVSCPSTGSIYRAELTTDGSAHWRETL